MSSFKVEKILCPIDFSEDSKYAVDYAIGLAEKLKATLYVIHIIPHIAYRRTSYYDVDDKTDLAKLCDCIPADISYKSELVKSDDIDEGIADYAVENDVDLIIIATHGHSSLVRILLGSTTESLSRKAPCPVTILHKPKK